MKWKLIVLIAMLAYGAFHHFSNRPIMHGNGLIASAQPRQYSTSQASLTLKDYAITPLQSF